MFGAFLLLLIVVVYRVALGFGGSSVLLGFHNFAPVAAVALCGAVYLPRRFAVALPLAMLLVSDVILNVFHYDRPLMTWEILPRYLALALIAAGGLALRNNARAGRLLAASAAGSVLFFFITNTAAWIGDPGYAKTAAGWLQALGPGLPGFPPTWWFYRHTLLSDLFFTLLFVGCMHWRGKKAALPAPRTVSA